MSDLQAVLDEIGEPQCAESLLSDWDEAIGRRPDGLPCFLDPARFREHRAWCGLPPETDASLDDLARRVAENPALLSLAWYAYDRLFNGGDGWLGCTAWPTLRNTLGEDAGLFRMLVALEIVPAMRHVHEKRGIPESVTRDTCLILSGMSANHGKSHDGRVGIVDREMGWLRHHINGRIYRIGRMEYMLRPFDGGIVAFRHRFSGQVLALAGDGLLFNARGLIDRDAQASSGDSEGWASVLRINDETATGLPVSPDGHALREPCTLALDTWEIVLQPGDTTLDMHIPEGGGMTLEKCFDSMRRGFEFFERYFPEKPASAVTCNSWIFGPPLVSFLPAEANLLRFMREVYLFPVPGRLGDGFFFIFGAGAQELESAPRETRLQRAVLDHVARGGDWRNGGMFFLRDDLQRFGASPYLSDWQHRPGP